MPNCEVQSTNHSADIIGVWTGKPTPNYVCGYHTFGGYRPES